MSYFKEDIWAILSLSGDRFVGGLVMDVRIERRERDGRVVAFLK